MAETNPTRTASYLARAKRNARSACAAYRADPMNPARRERRRDRLLAFLASRARHRATMLRARGHDGRAIVRPSLAGAARTATERRANEQEAKTREAWRTYYQANHTL